jgi:hypothetical protein
LPYGRRLARVLGKPHSQTLKAVPDRPVQAPRATEAGGPQAFPFGRLPQAMGGFALLTLYQWECNIRSAMILGFVGAEDRVVDPALWPDSADVLLLDQSPGGPGPRSAIIPQRSGSALGTPH